MSKFPQTIFEWTLESYDKYVNKNIPYRDAWPKIDQVEGWLVPGQEKWLFKTVKSLPNNSNIVEIGSYKGRSTCSMGIACINTNKRIFSIDTFKGNTTDFVSGKNEIEWNGENFFGVFHSNIEKCQILKYVVPLVGQSSDIAKIWRSNINFLFIDGSHEYNDVIADFNNFYPWVESGGIIALHDVTPDWKGPYQAWNEEIKQQLTDIGNFSSISFGRKP